MAQLKGKVLAGKVLVKPHEAEAKTASGIIIPDSAKENLVREL
jgi:chaperonin GroES